MTVKKIKLFFLLYGKDIIGAVKVLAPIPLVISVFFFSNQLIRKYNLSKLDIQTNETITFLNSKEGMRQTNEGGKKVVEYYEIHYNYVVDKKRIEQIEIISPRSLSWEDNKKLRQLKIGNKVDVYYSSNHPQKSMISL